MRLEGYDYSQEGCYFITICVAGRRNILASISGVGAGSSRPKTELTKFGEIAKDWLENIHIKYPNCAIDCYVIMPNHIHFILRINECGRDNPAPTVSQVVGYYKYQTTKQINTPGFWQRSYHDRIIRNEALYQRIWKYIDENPILWESDCYFTK